MQLKQQARPSRLLRATLSAPVLAVADLGGLELHWNDLHQEFGGMEAAQNMEPQPIPAVPTTALRLVKVEVQFWHDGETQLPCNRVLLVAGATNFGKVPT